MKYSVLKKVVYSLVLFSGKKYKVKSSTLLVATIISPIIFLYLLLKAISIFKSTNIDHIIFFCGTGCGEKKVEIILFLCSITLQSTESVCCLLESKFLGGSVLSHVVLRIHVGWSIK